MIYYNYNAVASFHNKPGTDSTPSILIFPCQGLFSSVVWTASAWGHARPHARRHDVQPVAVALQTADLTKTEVDNQPFYGIEWGYMRIY